MGINTFSSDDLTAALAHLTEHGYAVIEGVLSEDELRHYRNLVDNLFERERQEPFDPGDGPSLPGDDEIERYLNESYHVSEAELARLMRRIRYTRAQDQGTPWPVSPEQVSKVFLHLPTLFDYDKSQRIWNLLNKAPDCGKLVEHPVVIKLVQETLGAECVLSDCSATSIGSHTGGGAWHVNVPLGQLSEPLPDFPLTTQNAWMLDEFTTTNGATQVVPGSHLTRRKPKWGEQEEEGVILTAPAGSVAIWLSNTWHRSGPNSSDGPRRAILCYYCRSWVKSFIDYRSTLKPEVAGTFSPYLRYLLGFSAHAPVRG